MEELLNLAAIGWDFEIRGVLVVVCGSAVLFGSVWLILATNSGIRLATLLTLAGFFSWMFIMGTAWWMYGKGWVGDAPTWHAVDFNSGDLEESSVARATELPNRDEVLVVQADGTLQSPMALLRSLEGQPGVEAAIAEIAPTLTVDDAAYAETPEADRPAKVAADQIVSDQRAEQRSLSEIIAVFPGMVDLVPNLQDENLGGWELLSSAAAGELQTAASAAILEAEGFPFEAAADFRFLETYAVGGKPVLPDDPNRWDRISLWITNSARIKNPTRYAVVELQAVTEQSQVLLPGQAPRVPEIDADAEVISVVLIRDLGNLRLRPALITVGSLLILLALCYLLHVRDKELMARRAEFEGQN